MDEGLVQGELVRQSGREWRGRNFSSWFCSARAHCRDRELISRVLLNLPGALSRSIEGALSNRAAFCVLSSPQRCDCRRQIHRNRPLHPSLATDPVSINPAHCPAGDGHHHRQTPATPPDNTPTMKFSSILLLTAAALAAAAPGRARFSKASVTCNSPEPVRDAQANPTQIRAARSPSSFASGGIVPPCPRHRSSTGTVWRATAATTATAATAATTSLSTRSGRAGPKSPPTAATRRIRARPGCMRKNGARRILFRSPARGWAL